MQQALSDLTVDEVYSKYLSNITAAEQSNNVLDLVFDIDQVNISKEEQAANAEQDSVDLVQRIQSQYQPKNGFFDHFEKNGGVNKLILVAQESLKFW